MVLCLDMSLSCDTRLIRSFPGLLLQRCCVWMRLDLPRWLCLTSRSVTCLLMGVVVLMILGLGVTRVPTGWRLGGVVLIVVGGFGPCVLCEDWVGDVSDEAVAE